MPDIEDFDLLEKSKKANKKATPQGTPSTRRKSTTCTTDIGINGN